MHDQKLDLTDCDPSKIQLRTCLNDLNSDLNTRKLKIKMQITQFENELIQLKTLKAGYVLFFRSLRNYVQLNPHLVSN